MRRSFLRAPPSLGCVFKGEYLVADLTEFTLEHLRAGKAVRIFKAKELHTPKDGISFPLKQARERELQERLSSAMRPGDIVDGGADDEMPSDDGRLTLRPSDPSGRPVINDAECIDQYSALADEASQLPDEFDTADAGVTVTVSDAAAPLTDQCKVRKWTGAARPPTVKWPEIWQSMSPRRRLLEIAKYSASLEGEVWTEPPTDKYAKLSIVQLREECKACVPPLSSGGCKAKLLEFAFCFSRGLLTASAPKSFH